MEKFNVKNVPNRVVWVVEFEMLAPRRCPWVRSQPRRESYQASLRNVGGSIQMSARA